MLQYMDIIFKTYMGFLSPSWLQYDEQFHMHAAMNSMLWWDQVNSLLWLQITAPSCMEGAGGGEHADIGNLVRKSQASMGFPYPSGAGSSKTSPLLGVYFPRSL